MYFANNIYIGRLFNNCKFSNFFIIQQISLKISFDKESFLWTKFEGSQGKWQPGIGVSTIAVCRKVPQELQVRLVSRYNLYNSKLKSDKFLLQVKQLKFLNNPLGEVFPISRVHGHSRFQCNSLNEPLSKTERRKRISKIEETQNSVKGN